MKHKLQTLLALLLAFGMIFSACAPAPAATEAPAPAPVVEQVPPTEAPAVEVVVAPDFAEVFAGVTAALPADKGFGAVSAAKLNEELVDKAPFLLDVRETSELEANGYIEGAVNIPVRQVLANLDKLPGVDEPIVVYCGSGHRGAMVLAALKALGYSNVRNLGGGTAAWLKAGLPVETGTPAAAEAISTPVIADEALYGTLNQFLADLPESFYAAKADAIAEQLTEAPVLLDVRTQAEWDKDGYIEGATLIPFNEFFTSLDKLPQEKDAKIIVYCGSGHRGAMVMMGLRLMGYEDVTNLGGGLGAWKAANLPVVGWVNWSGVWAEYLSTLPEGYYSIKADALNTALVENPPFLLDVREPAELEKGFIAGAVNIPVREVLANLDKLPGLNDPIVIYCGSGHRGAMTMAALRMLGYTDVKNLAGGVGAWRKAELPLLVGESPAELVAGTAPEVDETRLRDLSKFLSELPEGFYAIAVDALNTQLVENPPFVLDVRTADEFATGYIEGAVNIEITTLPENLAQLPADKAAPIVALCQSGHRGAMTMMYLRMMGYTNVINVNGGMNAWLAAELPVVK